MQLEKIEKIVAAVNEAAAKHLEDGWFIWQTKADASPDDGQHYKTYTGYTCERVMPVFLLHHKGCKFGKCTAFMGAILDNGSVIIINHRGTSGLVDDPKVWDELKQLNLRFPHSRHHETAHMIEGYHKGWGKNWWNRPEKPQYLQFPKEEILKWEPMLEKLQRNAEQRAKKEWQTEALKGNRQR